jgi:myo-inositol-hexaphosphate 3-phosphohydrolase
MANTITTVISTSSPIVTKMIKNQTSTADITGLAIDYNTIANGVILAYNQTSNAFSPVAAESLVSAIDGGLVE